MLYDAQELVQALLTLALRWLTRLFPTAPLRLDALAPEPELEAALVEHCCAGAISFRRYTVIGLLSRDVHYASLNTVPAVHLRVDHAHGEGSYTFLTVGDRDLSYSSTSHLDLDRVSTAIVESRDAGHVAPSLYRC
jgi:hypothetical protein